MRLFQTVVPKEYALVNACNSEPLPDGSDLGDGTRMTGPGSTQIWTFRLAAGRQSVLVAGALLLSVRLLAAEDAANSKQPTLSESKPAESKPAATKPADGQPAAAKFAKATSRKGSADQASRVGRTIADFRLRDYRGAEHSLSDLDDKKLVVVAFLGTECPLVKLYGPRLAELDRKYRDRGVSFVGINANRQDSLTEIAAYARVHGIEFSILKDLGNKVADSFGAERTPEVFVLDSKRVVRYRGRIDDQYGVGTARDKATKNDLAAALDQLLADKPVALAETTAVGCFIGRVREPAEKPAREVTWSKHIAPLFQQKCVECHRAGEIAPFALTDYAESAGWAETIREVVQDRRMPPWHANPEHGHFANARRLKDEEIKLIEDWVAAGAPEGNAAEAPRPRSFTEGWQLPREPDAIVGMRDEPFEVQAEGTVPYKYFTVDPGFTEDKWVTMAEAQPGNRAVVHHILVLVRPPGGAAAGAGGGEFLVGYVPGMRAKAYPQGMAKLIPAGSRLVFQVHYTPNGTAQKDLSRLGLLFADKKDVTHVVVTSRAADNRFRIPPNEENYRIEATSSAHGADLLLLSLMPHMHLRGKAFSYEARYPDGTAETLLDVPRYDFNWQTSYQLAEPKTMPAGTRIHCVAHYDNSENNLANPDPSATVTWGDQTWNEMMIGYFDVASPIDGAQPPARARIIAAATPEARKRRAQVLLRQYDKNGDGEVQRTEVPVRILPIFDLLDRNKDKIVTEEEIMQAGELQGNNQPRNEN